MFFAVATVIASAAFSAMAQNSNVINVLGTVERIDATSISLKDDESGVVESFKLAPNVLVVQNKTATLADVKPSQTYLKFTA